MVLKLKPNQKKVYFTIFDISYFEDQYNWSIEDILYWLEERLLEYYTIEVDRLKRSFVPKSNRMCLNIQKFYVEMENKNCVAEYIPCPTWMHDSERNIKEWLENPILRPLNSGRLFILERKYPACPPNYGGIDGLAGAGGRL